MKNILFGGGKNEINYLLWTIKQKLCSVIQINQPTRCNSFASLLLDVFVWLNMFWVPLYPSSGAYRCSRSLWFYRWSVAVGALLVVVWPVIYIFELYDDARTCRRQNYVVCFKNAATLFLPKYTKRILKDVFPHVYTYVNVGL
jgi:hypothetical protein